MAKYLQACLMLCAWFSFEADAAEPVDFAHDVLPLLKAKCSKCHSNGTYKGGFSIDTRGTMLRSESVIVGSSEDSEFIARLVDEDPETRMPRDDDALTAEQVSLLRRWIDEGLAWEAGYSFKPKAYKARLEPRHPNLPAAQEGRTHPVDRLVDAYFSKHEIPRPAVSLDEAFLRRIHLDLVGELPERPIVEVFLKSEDQHKRERMIELLLADSIRYADHWLTFWNDLLRNDYRGTGFIDGGRKQITRWLYDSLTKNKPYDQFVRELIHPTPQSEGFIRGIKWRGRVNASQVTQLQFAQNVSQVMLGINMKCASCHDSFINDWLLKDAYGLAAIVSDEPLEIHRCDKPTGEIAQAAFIFPELGSIESDAPRTERLRQLAELITSDRNGRFARTIVNRIWDRLLGRGIVHPVDIMANRPFSEDLLDYLAADFVEHGYDLRHLLSRITTSQIYQSLSVPTEPDVTEDDYRFRGPVPRRLTAEQFQDAVWQLTRTGRPRKAAGDFGFRGGRPLRSSLVESNLLVRALGRPNREQVVTTRPAELTTLQALDLTNGDVLAQQLDQAAKRLVQDELTGAPRMVEDLYWRALTRAPNDHERAAARQLLGGAMTPEGIADLYWAVLMLPEFQMIR